MENKYCPQSRYRTWDPNKWVSGPDPFTREKYYAWHKHRAQARYRNEAYDLTFEDWQTLWSDEDFLKRGRGNHCLSLCRLHSKDSWNINNVEIITRMEHKKRGKLTWKTTT